MIDPGGGPEGPPVTIKPNSTSLRNSRRVIIDPNDFPNKRQKINDKTYSGLSMESRLVLQNMENNIEVNCERTITEIEGLIDDYSGKGNEEYEQIYQNLLAKVKKSCHMTSKNANAFTNKKNDIANILPVEYKRSEIGPFIVIAKSENQNLSRLHPMAFGKMLHNNNIHGIKNINKKGKNNIAIEFNNSITANNFLQSKSIKEKGIQTYIPRHLISCQGIIRGVNPLMTEEEVINSLDTTVKALHCRRFKRRDEPRWRNNVNKYRHGGNNF